MIEKASVMRRPQQCALYTFLCYEVEVVHCKKIWLRFVCAGALSEINLRPKLSDKSMSFEIQSFLHF
jgi:hypothetical protein